MPFFGAPSGGTSHALGRPRTYLTIVLDASSSMEHVRRTTIDAYNAFIAQQQQASAESKDEVFASLLVFADFVRTVYSLQPLHSLRRLDSEYRPDGMTALYDGIATAIETTERAVGENARVLALVITDGMENNSTRVRDAAVIKQMVESRQERGNWTFIFLSAGANPFQTGHGMGFKTGNINTYKGAVGQQLVVASRSVRNFRQGDDMQTDTFWAGSAEKHDRTDWVRGESDADVEDVVE